MEDDRDDIYYDEVEGQNENEYGDDLDDSGPNYSQALIEDSENGEESPQSNGKKSPFLLMLKVLFNPVEGWKSIRRSKLTVEDFQQGCFYPLLALLALSKFSLIFYAPMMNMSSVITEALSAFVAFFASYFIIIIIMKWITSGELKEKMNSDFTKQYIITCLSSLCLFFIIIQLLPMLWALLIFLPLWTVYIICRGTRFFKFPITRQITYTGILCILIVGMPCILDWALNEILPKG